MESLAKFDAAAALKLPRRPRGDETYTGIVTIPTGNYNEVGHETFIAVGMDNGEPKHLISQDSSLLSYIPPLGDPMNPPDDYLRMEMSPPGALSKLIQNNSISYYFPSAHLGRLCPGDEAPTLIVKYLPEK